MSPLGYSVSPSVLMIFWQLFVCDHLYHRGIKSSCTLTYSSFFCFQIFFLPENLEES